MIAKTQGSVRTARPEELEPTRGTAEAKGVEKTKTPASQKTSIAIKELRSQSS
jgi:hypothetical protein